MGYVILGMDQSTLKVYHLLLVAVLLYIFWDYVRRRHRSRV